MGLTETGSQITTNPMPPGIRKIGSPGMAFGNKIMIVATKRVASSYVTDFGEKTGMPYISHRWLGGMLTNWSTIQKRIDRLKELEAQELDGTLEQPVSYTHLRAHET